MATVTLDRVTKIFSDSNGDVTAVEDLSFDTEDGEFIVLVGPSGCGKSTTLRMLAGLETITDGELRVDGSTVNELRPQERDMAMVFQSYALYPHMTVRENMRFGLEESTTLASSTIDERVEDAADMMSIIDLLDRKPSELSGGQQQRVALGRAIVRDPQVFLLDEPLANLDAKLRAQMRTELQRLQEELNVTTVYVTHDQTEAMTMGDRIVILNDGILQQIATPLEAYHKPANRFVAGFIGEPSMNFFETAVQDNRLVSDGFSYPLPPEIEAAIGSENSVILGVRPEDIEVVSETENQHDFETTVDVVEPEGDVNNVYLSFESSQSESGTFVATVGGMRSVKEGESVTARIPTETVHLFETQTGDTLWNRSLEELEKGQTQV